MIAYKEFPHNAKMFLFELDDVLFPKKDYLLQVYYLFANYVEFNESRPLAGAMTTFMRDNYLSEGDTDLFDKIKSKFDLDEQYRHQFGRIQVHAQLPLKLLLAPDGVRLIRDLKSNDKQMAILTKGNPLEQLNKMKHMDWQGLDKGLKVYFLDELNFRNIEPIGYIADEFGIKPEEIVCVRNE